MWVRGLFLSVCSVVPAPYLSAHECSYVFATLLVLVLSTVPNSRLIPLDINWLSPALSTPLLTRRTRPGTALLFLQTGRPGPVIETAFG